MKFKTDDLAAQLESRHPLLKEMAYTFERLSLGLGIDPLITRILGKIEGDSGVHDAGRAIDFRDEVDGIWTYSAAQVSLLLNSMNSLYARKDGKNTLIHHSFNGGPYHFHLQMAANLKTYKNLGK